MIELDHGGRSASIPPSILTTAQFTTGPPWTSSSALQTHNARAKLISDGSALRVEPYFNQRDYRRKRSTSTSAIPPSILTTAQFTTGAPWTSTSALLTHTARAKSISSGSEPYFNQRDYRRKRSTSTSAIPPSLHPHNRAIYHRRAVDVHKCVTNTYRSGEINFGR